MAGDKLWVAGVELAEPASPRRRPRTGGVDLRSPTPATRRCYPHLNQARFTRGEALNEVARSSFSPSRTLR